MISDYSKIPPIIYESAGIIRSDDPNNSNDSAYLKRKLNYYEKILLEKELQLRILQDEVELLKKYEPQVNCTDIGKLLLIIKYRNYGVCLSYLLDYFHMSSSSFYFKTRLFFVGETILQRIYVLLS